MNSEKTEVNERQILIEIIDKLCVEHMFKKGREGEKEFEMLLTTQNEDGLRYLKRKARETADRIYGKIIYIRGLIEFTNYCKNNCFYCGIRKDNNRIQRYRLSHDQILECCHKGYEFGFRTFVLQGGEDAYFTDDKICSILSDIKSNYPDCAVTLSIGEKSRESYQAFFDAGADRYLLRHETANEEHYKKLHPSEMSLANRKQCLSQLKEIGYQGKFLKEPKQ